MFAFRVLPRFWIGGGLLGFLVFIFIGLPLMLMAAIVVLPVMAVVRLTQIGIRHHRRRRAIRVRTPRPAEWSHWTHSS